MQQRTPPSFLQTLTAPVFSLCWLRSESHQTPIDAALEGAGKDGVGVVIAQVVPSPFVVTSVLVVPEYRAASEKLLGRQEYSFTSLESFIATKVTVEAIRRAGPNLTRETLMRALDSMSSYDVGGYVVRFSPNNHNGSKFVDLTIIGSDLKFYN